MTFIYKSFLPQNSAWTVLKGVFRLPSQNVSLSVICPSFPYSCSSFKIHFEDPEIQKHVSESQILLTSGSVADILSSLYKYLSSSSSSSSSSSIWIPQNPVLYYEKLTEEMSNLPLQPKDFDSGLLTFESKDPDNRIHLLHIKIPYNYPNEPINEWSSQLPIVIVPESVSIKNLLISFLSLIQSLQSSWRNLEELDEECWVIDPLNPLTSDLYRRIVIDKGVSVQISIEPHHSIPDLIFLGSEDKVSSLRLNYRSKSLDYDWTESSLLINLKALLNVSHFPRSQEHNFEDYNLDCGICYSYRLYNQLPLKFCEKKNCGKPYHEICLFETILKTPTSAPIQKSLQTLFGKCLYCDSVISCKMPASVS